MLVVRQQELLVNDYGKWKRDIEAISEFSICQSWTPKIGDKVRLSSIGKAGEIISFSDDGMQLTVLCGVFRSTVNLTEVESLDGQKAEINTSCESKNFASKKEFFLSTY